MNDTPPRAGTQCHRILLALSRPANTWVSMPELAQIGSGSLNGFCMVHSRVADLRKRGYVIAHRNERQSRVTKSFYKLVV